MDNDHISQLIRDCQDNPEDLTEWEIAFIDSIKNWYAKNGALTNAQYDMLFSIQQRVTRG